MFKIGDIKNITNAIIINGNENTIVSQFNISYKKHYKNDFFIPIFWREDRQKYIIEAVREGAIGYIISTTCKLKDEIIKESIKINPEIIILQVENINNAIYEMAKFKRKHNMHIPIIAVTGSVGKTSTTKMIANLLEQEKKVLYDTGNNNTKPLLAWLMLNIEEYEVAVLEVGIGDKDVMLPISELLCPNIVAINNIGTAHIGKLGNKERILEEKIKLTTYMMEPRIVFLNNDDELLKNVILDSLYNRKFYSLKDVNNIKQEQDGISFETNLYEENTKLYLKTYGVHNVLNAICAIKIAEIFNIKKENIVKGIKNYVTVDRRFKVIRKRDYIIIDDTYNASIDSMRAGLISVNDMNMGSRKIAILGEMLELGEYSKELHEQVGEIFKDVDFDILLTQGKNTIYICENAKKYMKDKTIINFAEQEKLIEYILKEIEAGDLIYLKASKKMDFDIIVKSLLENNVSIAQY